MPDQAHSAPSAVMAVYLQQRRFDRMRTARAIARVLTVAALAACAVVTVLWGRPEGSDSVLVRTLIGGGLLAWVAAFVCDYKLHSNRLNSRMIMMRLQAVQDQLDELEGPPRRSGASS